MLLIGLTGGIGCGKSTAVNAFRALGVEIIDTDKISKRQVKPGSQCLVKIAETFGDDILLSNGELNRPKLKEIVFSNPNSLKLLETIIHPNIRKEINKQVLMAKKTDTPYIVVDVPLLLEKDYKSMFDRILVVDCSTEQQIERVKQRDNLSEVITKAIMKEQVCREERLKASTDIIDNSGTLAALRTQVEKLHQNYLKTKSIHKQ